MQLDGKGWRSHYDEIGGRFDPLDRRLMHEHLLLIDLMESDDDLDCGVIEAETIPPRAYRIVFRNLPTFVNIQPDQSPVLASEHVMELHLPVGYPIDAPVCYMVSAAWHPNIQHETGPYQGRICGNTEGFGSFFSLDDLVLRVRSMLRYETYHAEMRFPYPEDEHVARWVREVAEPMGWVKAGRGISLPIEWPQGWQSMLKTENRMKVRVHS
jgi:hypothetical protein